MRSSLTARVLVVDDDPLVREVLSIVLTEGGFACRTASDGFEAIRSLLESPYDIVISDLRMPNISGFELLGIIRQRFPKVMVVVISSEPDPRLDAWDEPIDAFFRKGAFTHEQLLVTMRTLCKRHKSPHAVSKPLRVTRPVGGRIEISSAIANGSRKKIAGANRKPARNVVRFNMRDEERAGFRVRGIYDPWEQAWRIKTWPTGEYGPVHDCWVKGAEVYKVKTPGATDDGCWRPCNMGEKDITISGGEKKAILSLIDKWEVRVRRSA